MNKQQALNRISLLLEEIDANEEENQIMLKEIQDLYSKIDSGEFEERDGIH